MHYGYIQTTNSAPKDLPAFLSACALGQDALVVEQGDVTEHPQLNALLGRMTKGDVLHVEAFSQLGSTSAAFMAMVVALKAKGVSLHVRNAHLTLSADTEPDAILDSYAHVVTSLTALHALLARKCA